MTDDEFYGPVATEADKLRQHLSVAESEVERLRAELEDAWRAGLIAVKERDDLDERVAEMEAELAGKPSLICPACGAETRARLTDQEQLDRIAELEADVRGLNAQLGAYRTADARIAELEAELADALPAVRAEQRKTARAEARLAAAISGVQAWCSINEIAEPPLDWVGLGEFLVRAAATGDPT